MSHTEIPSNGKTILIAEDDPIICRMYRTKLTNAGFTVAIARDGRDTLRQIKELDPDLIMLDISMPELTGFQVIKALQDEGGNASEVLDKIIIITNSANPDDQDRAAELHLEYMIKADTTPKDMLTYIKRRLGMLDS